MRSLVPMIALSLSVSPSAMAQAPHVPMSFQGRWAASLETCQSPGDGRLDISTDSVRFFASRGKVLAVRAKDLRSVELDLELTGEGATWRLTVHFVLSEDNHMLTDVSSANPQHHLSRVRCA
jgi:hypothetical protein